MSSESTTQPLIDVRDLTIAFGKGKHANTAVNHVSFAVAPGETVAVVGESGSGKSVSALAMTRLLQSPPAHYLGGEIHFEGRNTLTLSERELRSIRGGRIAYIFQEPGSSLNPVFTIGYQIAEALRLHRPEVTDINAEVIHALDLVGIKDAASRIGDYPHQLSGGMQQRVMIAMALSCHPRLLIADEPTTALDVTIQKQIMDLLRELKERIDMAVLLITHNFSIVSGFADRVVVMFRGKIVEQGPTEQVLRDPQHPYTRALIACVPRIGQNKHRLQTIDYSELENV